MNKSLLIQALTKFLAGIVLVALLLFLPAASFAYWQAWLLMGILSVPMFFVGIILLLKSPDLLRKRLNAKEKDSEQKAVVAISGCLFLIAFIVAGLNWRFQWLLLPDWVVYAASALFVASYFLYAEVLRENAYLSRTVEVQENQKVIDTGLYGIVRHPMYAATAILFLAMPLVLGSLPSFVIMLGYIPVIVKRIRGEESVLEEGLAGYKDYKKKVKYRLFPFIW